MRSWFGFSTLFALAAVLSGLALAAFILAVDPFGTRVRAGERARPIMDINQRYMYPQLVRSGRFDAAIFGTSTMRLVDPSVLSQALGWRVANLAMNAATPWEQTELAKLFVAEQRAPKALIWGIDTTWCEPGATSPAARLTARSFPPWLYDSNKWNDVAPQMSFQTLEIAARLAGHRLGLSPERIRGDGYEVFTPPEARYDLAQARSHIYRDTGGVPRDLSPVEPPEAVPAAERGAWRFPALDWLTHTLAPLPATTLRIFVLPPAHLAAYPRVGSAGWQRFEACKAELVVRASSMGARVVDLARPSPVTADDASYWDGLHFRLPIARRLDQVLIAVARGEPLPQDGFAVRLGGPR